MRAFEYQAGPTEIYQAREHDDGSLVGERLDLHVEKKRASAAVVVGDDLGSIAPERGARSEPCRPPRRRARRARAALAAFTRARGLRIVADYETALGVFARYLDVLAVEYLSDRRRRSRARASTISQREERRLLRCQGPPALQGRLSKPDPVRADLVGLQHAPHASHLARGHAPQRRRLRRLVGTPVYAACYGNIEWIGDGGPSGNLVTIRHAGGITTGYAHLSRFAPHLAQGQSGRNAAAHRLRRFDRALDRPAPAFQRQEERRLHRSALAPKLDGDRVLPKPERAAFEEQRAALDKMLDAIPLPAAPAEARTGPRTKPKSRWQRAATEWSWLLAVAREPQVGTVPPTSDGPTGPVNAWRFAGLKSADQGASRIALHHGLLSDALRTGNVTMNVLPSPDLGLDPRLAAVALGDVLHQREADAAAAHLLVGARRAAHEALEDPPALGRGNARALVAHADLETALRRAHLDRSRACPLSRT